MASTFQFLPGHILDYEKATDNVYSRSQVRHLDMYLYKKARQAANKIGILDQAKAASERRGYVRSIHPVASSQSENIAAY